MDDNTDHNLGGVFIGTHQIYAQLLEMKYDLKAVMVKIDRVGETQGDHESRIRGLEKWKYAISVSVVGSLSALAITVIKVINP
ncbi:hypothetical protein [Streptosporangium sp. NPDC002524]|uniref:hypothetical protein n=1 Tax=Streptosporangium sp. NPDC002524 TaxID=3154537 RepID=UPI0033170FBE